MKSGDHNFYISIYEYKNTPIHSTAIPYLSVLYYYFYTEKLLRRYTVDSYHNFTSTIHAGSDALTLQCPVAPEKYLKDIRQAGCTRINTIPCHKQSIASQYTLLLSASVIARFVFHTNFRIHRI